MRKYIVNDEVVLLSREWGWGLYKNHKYIYFGALTFVYKFLISDRPLLHLGKPRRDQQQPQHLQQLQQPQQLQRPLLLGLSEGQLRENKNIENS